MIAGLIYQLLKPVLPVTAINPLHCTAGQTVQTKRLLFIADIGRTELKNEETQTNTHIR